MAVTHPNRVIGTPISIVLATAAYLIDKKVLHSIHPKIPKYIGLSQGFYSLNECTSVEDAQLLLCAAAAVPPVMPPLKLRAYVLSMAVTRITLPSLLSLSRRR